MLYSDGCSLVFCDQKIIMASCSSVLFKFYLQLDSLSFMYHSQHGQWSAKFFDSVLGLLSDHFSLRETSESSDVTSQHRTWVSILKQIKQSLSNVEVT